MQQDVQKQQIQQDTKIEQGVQKQLTKQDPPRLAKIIEQIKKACNDVMFNLKYHARTSIASATEENCRDKTAIIFQKIKYFEEHIALAENFLKNCQNICSNLVEKILLFTMNKQTLNKETINNFIETETKELADTIKDYAKKCADITKDKLQPKIKIFNDNPFSNASLKFFRELESFKPEMANNIPEYKKQYKKFLDQIIVINIKEKVQILTKKIEDVYENVKHNLKEHTTDSPQEQKTDNHPVKKFLANELYENRIIVTEDFLKKFQDICSNLIKKICSANTNIEGIKESFNILITTQNKDVDTIILTCKDYCTKVKDQLQSRITYLSDLDHSSREYMEFSGIKQSFAPIMGTSIEAYKKTYEESFHDITTLGDDIAVDMGM